MDQLSKTLNNAWEQWYNDHIFQGETCNFTEFVYREGGFKFHRHYSGERTQIVKIDDEQKYTWFLMKFA